MPCGRAARRDAKAPIPPLELLTFDMGEPLVDLTKAMRFPTNSVIRT